jgi:hypothetical protein
LDSSEILVELSDSGGLVQLHDLCALARRWVVAQGLPFEADLGESIFDIRISLNLPCGFVLLMVELDSDVCAVDGLPNEVDNTLNRFLHLSDIDSADVSDVATELPSRCMVHVEDCQPLDVGTAREH